MKNQISLVTILLCLVSSVPFAAAEVQWDRMSSVTGDIPIPNEGDQQTCCVVCDIDKDGKDDFVVGERTQKPAVVWYRFNGKKFQRFVIEAGELNPEAGGAACDIDKDGDIDIVFGQDASGNDMWWWENPYPNFESPWKRRYIKKDGANKHHDQSFADYDGDGEVEFLSWNQGGKKLLLFEIPQNPKTNNVWKPEVIHTWEEGRQLEGFPSIPVDVDLDGTVDIVGGGRWFKHKGNSKFEAHILDDALRFTQCAAGQLVEGGRPEIVFSPGDMNGDAKWFQWKNGEWVAHKLRYVTHGHTCEIRDVDGDGHDDLMIGEMGDPGAGDDAKIYIWYGDGKGNLKETIALDGQGIHEGLFGDFDGDDDLDILVKPYHHNSPRIDILFNRGNQQLGLDTWKRHLIDRLPKRSMFIDAVDLDGDRLKDLVAGGWWWKNPGNIDGNWTRHTIGEPLRNMSVVFDADKDGDFDIVGTQGVGSEKNHQHLWARNDGKGNFSLLQNIKTGGDGDFLQGCVLANFSGTRQVLLSWHNDGGGIQALTVPENPSENAWDFSTVTEFTEKEDLSVGDIDRDGDLDVLTGEHWLENRDGSFSAHRLGHIREGEADRNDLADVNGDGRLDAIIALELFTDVYWFEAPEDPRQEWKRHQLGTIAGQGFSMDTADFDYDGDPDVVIGEHRGEKRNRVVLFENQNNGKKWIEHVLDSDSKDNIDHHDGTVAVDLDNDEDLDIISIGWYNPKVWVFENKAIE